MSDFGRHIEENRYTLYYEAVKDTLGGCLEFNFSDSVEREKEVNWLSRIKKMTVQGRDTDVRGIETKARKNGGREGEGGRIMTENAVHSRAERNVLFMLKP